MRFNSRELMVLAQQKSVVFDKEGILQIKEKQDGLFRKGEVYVPRLFRLRGNLLFYFKTKDPASEVLGLMVLERVVVELDLEEELPYSFILVFEGDDKVIHLAAASEEDRDSWIEHLHISSYECMKMQLESLRDQIKSRTGLDPIDNPEPSELPDTYSESSDHSEPFLEMCIACEGLPYNNVGREPDTFATIHYLTPPHQHWTNHAHTEIVEKSTCPIYLTTIGFCNPHKVLLSTRIKICVNDVKERMTNTMTQIGTVQFTLSDLLTSSDGQIQLRLNAGDSQDVGNITVLAWHNVDQFESLDANTTSEVFRPLKDGRKRLEMLKPIFENIITKTYRFPTSHKDEELSVHEYMAESKLTYYLPKQFLRLWVEEEKQRIEQLQDLGQLIPVYKLEEQRLLDVCTCNSVINCYMQCLQHYTKQSKGAPFKPSAKKNHKEVEFAPTNLHLQRIFVQNDKRQTSGCYDVTTHGAFTAAAQKYKHGGLRKQLQHLEDCMGDQDSVHKMANVNKTMNSVTVLRQDVDKYCNVVCQAAVQGDSAAMNNAVSMVQDKTRQLIAVCETELVQESVDDYNAMRQPQQSAPSDNRPHSDTFLNVSSSVARNNLSSYSDTSPEKSWKWSGTDFVKSPTQEPWELTRLNVEASLMCLVSQVEALLKGDLQSCHWLDDISPLVIKLQKCIEVMCARARVALTFVTIKESGPNVALMHSIKYRRDVVFSQAVTTATSGFLTLIRSCGQDESLLRQLFQIGVLMEFESLLSCHGDELWMLEDMAVGVSDLSTISFKIIRSSSADDNLPYLKGNRTGYVLEIPIPECLFQLMPKEIQKGHLIQVVPVIFNIGINEQATLAGRFGDTSLQEAINAESYERLYPYYEKFIELVDNKGQVDGKGSSAFSLDLLMRELQVNVISKKNKNIHTLALAAEVCRKLNGIRFTNCKSGKDRTSMSVTLEQVRILQQSHDLASHVFMQALNCMRSEGVRRENTMKNCGSAKYAFNAVQLMAFPKLYRPPNGTYGFAET